MKRHVAPHPDAQIAKLQQRIHLDRIALTLSIQATQQALREQLTSPAMLLAATGAGFVLGRVISRPAHADGTARPRARWGAAALEAVRTALKFASSAPVLWVARFASRRRPQADVTPAPISEQPVL
jgi:hypothetical protein